MTDDLTALTHKLKGKKARLKVKEYAIKYSLNRRTVYRYIDQGLIKGIRIGNVIRIEDNDE